jgi:hypothetical protein
MVRVRDVIRGRLNECLGGVVGLRHIFPVWRGAGGCSMRKVMMFALLSLPARGGI